MAGRDAFSVSGTGTGISGFKLTIASGRRAVPSQRYFQHSDFSPTEITFALGFADPSNFYFPDLAVWVAANRTIPEEIVEHLVSHQRIPVRVAVASNPGISERIIEQLARDKSDLVRMRIACNARATREVLAALVADPCIACSNYPASPFSNLVL